ncbi:TPA: hypothetical protein ACH3X1_009393 [Trebouxia sp. C0004]
MILGRSGSCGTCLLPQSSKPTVQRTTRYHTCAPLTARHASCTQSSKVSKICCSYQRDVEQNAPPKAPSAPPPPNTTRQSPPPPPPPPRRVPEDQPAGQTRRTIVAVLGIAAVAYGYNVTQHPERLPAPTGPPPAKSVDVYANSALRPERVWPSGSPENPFTKVIYWRKAPYALLRKDGWMRVYGMQTGKSGKVELIMEARGGNQYALEVPLRQVRPWDMNFMNALFNSLIDWDSHLKPLDGRIKNRNLELQ